MSFQIRSNHLPIHPPGVTDSPVTAPVITFSHVRLGRDVRICLWKTECSAVAVGRVRCPGDLTRRGAAAKRP